MDNQGVDRTIRGRLKRGVRNLLISILIGALVFGILFGLIGLTYAIKVGPVISGKGGPYTSLEWVTDHFFGGMMYGGVIGVIGWVALVLFDQIDKLLKRFFPTTLSSSADASDGQRIE